MHTKNHMHTHAYHFTHGYQKSQSQHIVYASWDMEWDRQIFCRFGPFFCPFTPLATQKIKMLKKFKKKPQDIIILHKCSTKNHDDTMHCSWDMVCDGCNSYFSFWAIFRPFISLTTQKIKILQKWKKHLEI